MPDYTGYTEETSENLLLNAGAFFKDFEVGTDTYASAVAAGKLLGATKGGGEFKAIPEIRNIEVDGVPGKAKGMQVVDAWEVSLMANMLEVSKEVIKAALASVTEDVVTSEDYDIISANTELAVTDYIGNITWVGRLAGSDKPVIIQVYNALNTGGLTVSPKDKGEAVTQLIFDGHFTAADLTTPPFKIYYPKAA